MTLDINWKYYGGNRGFQATKHKRGTLASLAFGGLMSQNHGANTMHFQVLTLKEAK